MRFLVAITVFAISIGSAAANADKPETMSVSVIDQAGLLHLGLISIRNGFDEHADRMKKVSSQTAVNCAIMNFTSTCFQLKNSFYPDDPHGTAWPDDKLVFVHPISQVAVWLSGRHNGDGHTRQPVPMPLVGKPMAFYDKIIGDEYFVDAYDIDFEPIDIVQDGQLALQRLDEMVGKPFPEECPAKDAKYSFGPYCSGVFRWVTSGSDKGHAWCKYVKAGDIISSPYGCTALSIIRPDKTYIRAFASPFYGEGFGQGTGGIICSGREPVQLTPAKVDSVGEILSGEPFDIHMQAPRKIGSSFYQLAGERLYVKSKVFPTMFEATTVVLSVSTDPSQGMLIFGEAVLTVSGQLQRERSGYSEADDKTIDTYRTYFVDNLSGELTKKFGQKVLCNAQ